MARPAGGSAADRGGFSVETVVHVARPQPEVFDYLTDTASFPTVDRALVDYQPRGRLAPGMAGTFAHRRVGMTARTTWRVEELLRPDRVRVSISGMGYAMESLASLARDDDGTVVRFVDSVWPTSLPGRVLVALSGSIMRRDLRARAGRFKAILEGARPEVG